MTHALEGVTVLELASYVSGPYAGMLLGDLGAEIIKIEDPKSGDPFRGWGAADYSATFGSVNRNKKSVILDLKSPEGVAAARALAEKADVIIENYRTGTMDRLGLGWEELSKKNPRLIYCSITGFGQNGPYAKRAGYDFMIQGLGGLMSLTGKPDGEEGAGPMKVGVALTDILTGLYATVGVLAALNQREQSGLGQHIDVALLDVQVACLANQAMNYLNTGVSPKRLGNAHPNIVPYQDFPSADGNFIIAVGNDGQFRKLCEVAGCAALADDPRFSSNKARVAHRTELIPLLRQATVFKTTAEWVTLLEAAGVPCGPINDLAQVFADPQVKARGLRIDLPNSLGSTTPQVASPLRLSETPVQYRNAPPLLGEHTEQVLSRHLGLSAEQISALRAASVL